ISYVINTDDYRAWLRYTLTHSKDGSLRRRVRWGWVAFLLIGWLYWIVQWLVFRQDDGPDITLLILLSIATACWLFSLLWLRFVIWVTVDRQSAADKAKMAGVHTILLTPEALSYSSEHSSEKTAWLGIERIVVTEQHVFFFIMSQAGHGVPRRAFVSDEGF